MIVLKQFCVAVLFALGIASGTATASAGEQAASALDRIRETGEITIGVRRDARPHSYVGDDGVPAGYTVAICDQVAQKLRGQLGLTQLLIRH